MPRPPSSWSQTLQPTVEKLHTLKADRHGGSTLDITEPSFEERLGLLVDGKMIERENWHMSSRLRRAKLRHAAILEDIDYWHLLSMDTGLVHSLVGCY